MANVIQRVFFLGIVCLLGLSAGNSVLGVKIEDEINETSEIKKDEILPEKFRIRERGLVSSVSTGTLKSPNSAFSKIGHIRLINGYESTAYTPEEFYNLEENSVALIRGGRVKDFPGMRYHIMHGTRGKSGVKNRNHVHIWPRFGISERTPIPFKGQLKDNDVVISNFGEDEFFIQGLAESGRYPHRLTHIDPSLEFDSLAPLI